MTFHPITGFPNTRESDNRNSSDIVLSNRISRTNIKKYVGQGANISAEIYNTITIKFQNMVKSKIINIINSYNEPSENIQTITSNDWYELINYILNK